MLEFRVTPKMREQLDWAYDAMYDYALNEECEYSVNDLFIIVDDTFLADNNDVLEDLLYRLKVQFPNMYYNEPLQQRNPQDIRYCGVICEHLIDYGVQLVF